VGGVRRLLSYGPNFVNTFRRAAEQVGMVLNGRKPAEMAVEQPITFELVINLKTATALGGHDPAVDPSSRRQGYRVNNRQFSCSRSVAADRVAGPGESCPLATACRVLASR